MRQFVDRHGFARSEVSLANWREQPYSRWSFQHVSEIVPSARIRTEPANDRALLETQPLDDRTVRLGDEDVILREFLVSSSADLFLMSQTSRDAIGWSNSTADPTLPHIIFSISKSVTGLLAGILSDRGELDAGRRIADYLPCATKGAYGDCTLRDVLDMRVSLDFTEDYLDRTGAYARYRRAMGWNPPADGLDREGLVDVVTSLKKGEADHGGPFSYQSPNADLAALVIESATGVPYAELMSELLWTPLHARSDAFITLDRYGAPRGSGGLSVHLEDMLALGRLVIEGGAQGTRQIIPEIWLAELMRGGDRQAWQAGKFASFLPGGSYRDFWYCGPDGAVFGVGIHGQWLYVNPASGTVIVWLASQELPQDDSLDAKILSVLAQLSA